MTGTSGGSGERDATQPLRDKEEGLASVEAEANRGRPSPRCGVLQQRGPQEGPPGNQAIGLYAVASAHNNRQSAAHKLQAGRYGSI